MRRKDRVVSKKLVEDHIFGLSGDVASNAVEVYIHRLRKQLSERGAKVQIHTIRGVGYLISEEKTGAFHSNPSSRGSSSCTSSRWSSLRSSCHWCCIISSNGRRTTFTIRPCGIKPSWSHIILYCGPMGPGRSISRPRFRTSFHRQLDGTPMRSSM